MSSSSSPSSLSSSSSPLSHRPVYAQPATTLHLPFLLLLLLLPSSPSLSLAAACHPAGPISAAHSYGPRSLRRRIWLQATQCTPPPPLSMCHSWAGPPTLAAVAATFTSFSVSFSFSFSPSPSLSSLKTLGRNLKPILF